MAVDFNDDASGSPTQSGWTPFPVGTSWSNTQSVAGHDVTLFVSSDNLLDFDRGAVGDPANALSDLARDFAYRSGGVQLRIGATTPLPAGIYRFTGYHHDTGGGVGEPRSVRCDGRRGHR